MKQRVLAGLGAIVLIAAALVLRGQLADGSSGSGGGGGRGGSRPVVACTPDLQPVCDALVASGRIEAADPIDLEPQVKDGPTAASPPAEVDGWITWDAIPAVVNFEASATWTENALLGGAPTAVVIRGPELAGLRGACAELTWTCVATGDLHVGVGQPETAEGLARIGALRSALLEAGASAAEFDQGLLTDILSGPTDGQEALADQLKAVVQQAKVRVVVGPAPALETLAQRPAGVNVRLQVATPSPPASMTVVLATRDGADLGDLADRALADEGVRRALTDIGVEPGAGELLPGDTVAGFLYQVRRKVG